MKIINIFLDFFAKKMSKIGKMRFGSAGRLPSLPRLDGWATRVSKQREELGASRVPE